MIFLKSVSLHVLLLFQGIFLLYYGNYVLTTEAWAALASIQYGVFIVSAFCWFGTDISGIKQIRLAKTTDQKNDLITNIIATRLLLLMVTCPIIIYTYKAQEAFLLIALTLAYLLTPTFYFYGNQGKFDHYFIADIALRAVNICIISYSIMAKSDFTSYLILIVLSQFTYVIYLFIRIDHFNLLSALKSFDIARINLKVDDKAYFLMQINQQVLYSFPTILLTNFGREESAVLFTNVERVLRICRGIVGNAVKVLLGSDHIAWDLLSKKININQYILISHFMFLVICVCSLFNSDEVYLQAFFIIIMMFTLPLTALTSLCVGIKYRTYNFPRYFTFILLFSIVFATFSFMLIGTSILFIAILIMLSEATICLFLIYGDRNEYFTSG